MDLRDEDLALLGRLLPALRALKVDEDDEEAFAVSPKRHLSTFEDMLSRMEKWRIRVLSEKQRSFARDTLEKATDTPQYENAWSAGKIARGGYGRTAVPEVLRKPLPLKPPGRV